MVTTLAVSTNLTYLTVAEEPLLLFTLIKSTVASTTADMSIAQLGLSTIARYMVIMDMAQGQVVITERRVAPLRATRSGDVEDTEVMDMVDTVDTVVTVDIISGKSKKFMLEEVACSVMTVLMLVQAI